MAMTNAALGDNVIGKMLYITHVAFEHRNLKAVLVVNVYVQC